MRMSNRQKKPAYSKVFDEEEAIDVEFMPYDANVLKNEPMAEILVIFRNAIILAMIIAMFVLLVWLPLLNYCYEQLNRPPTRYVGGY